MHLTTLACAGPILGIVVVLAFLFLALFLALVLAETADLLAEAGNFLAALLKSADFFKTKTMDGECVFLGIGIFPQQVVVGVENCALILAARGISNFAKTRKPYARRKHYQTFDYPAGRKIDRFPAGGRTLT